MMHCISGRRSVYLPFLFIVSFIIVFAPARGNSLSSPGTFISDTSKKDTTSVFEYLSKHHRMGKFPFYGTWTDYFSSYLTIHRDSTFKFSRGRAPSADRTWIRGQWERKKDTFYFLSDYAILNLNPALNAMPSSLVFYKNRLFHLDSTGLPVKGKIPSPAMGKKNKPYRTFYYRESKFNFDYFDSAYYQSALKRRFKMGTGINVVLQPLAGYRVVGSVGFILSPRYLFARKEYSYWSVGIPLTTGFSRFDDSLSVDLKLGLMIDLPLIGNYNFLSGSAERPGRLSYFAGGGFAYHYNNYTAANHYGTITQEENNLGPVINVGLRIALKKYRLQDLELKCSYTKLVVNGTADVFAIGMIMNF